MDIKKGKVLRDRDWSLKTQKNLASMLGITAALSLSGAALTACDEGIAGGDIETEPSSSEQMTDGMGPIDDRWQDMSSSSEKMSSSVSSSSSEKMSSSLGPTSGISSSSEPPRPMSSSDEILTPGVLPPSSSSYEIDTLDVTSGEVVPPEFIEPESGTNIDTGHLESSSSVASSSSSLTPRSSSSATAGLPLSSSIVAPPSSSSEEPLPGDPIEEVIIIDDPKD